MSKDTTKEELEDFLAKAVWDGGLVDYALSYGSSGVPYELHAEAEALEEAYLSLRSALDALAKRLDAWRAVHHRLADARKRREEDDPVEMCQRGMELLADAVANAIWLGLIQDPLTQVNAGVMLDFNSFHELNEFYKCLDSRLEPF